MAALLSGRRLFLTAQNYGRVFYSAAAAQQGLVKPPVAVFGVEGRYAHALYSAASKKNSLDKVEKELNDFQQLVTSEQKLQEYLSNPTLRKEQKQALIEDVMKKQNYSNITVNLFSALGENNRFNRINGVVKTFNKIMSAHRGEVLCTVISAKQLNDKNVKALQAVLNGFVKKDETLKIEMKVDPSLLGGMVVEIGDKYIDMSTATKIKKMTEALREVV